MVSCNRAGKKEYIAICDNSDGILFLFQGWYAYSSQLKGPEKQKNSTLHSSQYIIHVCLIIKRKPESKSLSIHSPFNMLHTMNYKKQKTSIHNMTLSSTNHFVIFYSKTPQ